MAADALKRIQKVRDKQFQDKVSYYMWKQAYDALISAPPDADDIALCKAFITRTVNVEDLAMIVITDDAIGELIDAEKEITDSDIETSVNAGKFHALAMVYKAVGVI